MRDEELVAIILKGSPHLFSEIVDRYKDRIFNITVRFTNGHCDSQDLAQEIFLLVYRNLASFRGQSSFSTWLYRLSVNRCLDWCRKNKQNQTHVLHPICKKEFREDFISQIPTELDTPEKILLKKEQDRNLHQAIALLPEKYKAVVIMYHFQELSYKEMGDILHLPVRTVETHLYRAKQRLKELLIQQEGGVSRWNTKIVRI